MESGWELVRYTGENDAIMKDYYLFQEPYITFFPNELEHNINLIKYKIIHCIRFIQHRDDYNYSHLPILLSQNISQEQTYCRNLERLLDHYDHTTAEYFTIEQELYSAYSELYDFLWKLEIKKTILRSHDYANFQKNIANWCDSEETNAIHRNEYKTEDDRTSAVKNIEHFRHTAPIHYLQEQYQKHKSTFLHTIFVRNNLIAAISQCSKNLVTD